MSRCMRRAMHSATGSDMLLPGKGSLLSSLPARWQGKIWTRLRPPLPTTTANVGPGRRVDYFNHLGRLKRFLKMFQVPRLTSLLGAVISTSCQHSVCPERPSELGAVFSCEWLRLEVTGARQSRSCLEISSSTAFIRDLKLICCDEVVGFRNRWCWLEVCCAPHHSSCVPASANMDIWRSTSALISL